MTLPEILDALNDTAAALEFYEEEDNARAGAILEPPSATLQRAHEAAQHLSAMIDRQRILAYALAAMLEDLRIKEPRQ